MKTSIQARLDENTQEALDVVMRRHGWSASRAVREGLHLLARQPENGSPRKIIGIGQFDSGIPDLGSNKKHLEGLGLNSGISRATYRKRKKR